jgi:hypothetical protein
MNTIKTFIPSYAVESFTKFANRTKKYVPNFDFKVGKPYQKVFNHYTLQENGMRGKMRKKFHEVCDLVIYEPEESDWRLLVTYKDDNFIPADPSKKIIFKNPKHGLKYGMCDVCNHRCKDSYIIMNIKTGEELQVGYECAKKFGVKSFDYLSKFNNELYAMYDYSISYATDKEFGDPDWGGRADTSWMNAYEKSKLIMAAKKEFNVCPIWKKGYRLNSGEWQPSWTGIHIVKNLCDKDLIVDEEYVAKVCEYILSQPSESVFQDEMQELAKNFYCYESQNAHAFFMVKSYEEYIKPKVEIKNGTAVKVEGKIVQQRTQKGFYGVMIINSIITDNGTVCERIGKIPTFEDKDGSIRTVFYTTVKGMNHNSVVLDRAIKNPKKGVEYVSL